MEFLAAVLAIVALIFVLKMRKRVTELELRVAQLTGIATQLFVALAEEGITEGPIAESVARLYLNDLFNVKAANDKPDTLVLGCTHFPMLAGAIRAVVGPQVTLVDSAATTAQHVRKLLATRDALSSGETGDVRFLATDSVERFARVGSRFLGRAVAADEIELINL